MARFTITPVRSLAAGYTAGVPVDIEIGMESIDWDPNPVKSENVSLGGARETIADRLEIRYSVKTVAIALASRALWRMLVNSIALGEEFVFDPEGTVASPTSDLGTFKLDGKANEENLEGRWVKYSFRIVKA